MRKFPVKNITKLISQSKIQKNIHKIAYKITKINHTINITNIKLTNIYDYLQTINHKNTDINKKLTRTNVTLSVITVYILSSIPFL
jgi:CRISPR/Cas system CSM-associated protein Csm2 small subunit